MDTIPPERVLAFTADDQIMNSPRHQHPSTPNTEKTSAVTPLAAGAAILGVCCGLPLLASVGVLGAVAGIGLGSWLIVALAAAVALIGLVRWHRADHTCPTPRADDHPAPHMSDTVLSPTRPYRNEEESR